jgi:hypothetical protein
MLKKRMILIPFFVLASLCATVSAADTVVVQYVKTGPNGGYPLDTLKVHQSGSAQLLTTTFNLSAMKTYAMTQVEFNALIALFTDNSFSTLDSSYQSGCLACAMWSITYEKKTVRGNNTGTSVPLANIKAGLDSLVTKIINSTSVVLNRGSSAGFAKNSASSILAKQSLRHEASFRGIEIVRPTGLYTIQGQCIIRAR